MDEQQPPVVPEAVRTAAYLIGAVCSLGIGPALAALGLPEAGVAVSALGGAASAIAFGYRPTRS